MQGRNIPWTRWVLHAGLGWAGLCLLSGVLVVGGGEEGCKTDTRMWAFCNTALHSSWLRCDPCGTD